MRLTLRLQSYCGQPPDKPQEKTYEKFPMYIGRSPSCDFILNDISRYISSNHATVLVENEQLLIQDTSANGLYLNGSTESVGRGNVAVLGNGDSLTIGDYSLVASISASAHPSAEADPFGDFGLPDDSSPKPDPFDPFRGEEHDWTPESEKPHEAGFPNDDDWAIGKPENLADTAEDSNWPDWFDDDAGSSDSPRERSPHPKPSDNDLDWLPGTSSETISTPRPIDHPGSVPIAATPPPPANNRPFPAEAVNRLSPHQGGYAQPQGQGMPAPQPQRPRAAVYPAQPQQNSDVAINTLLRSAGLNPADFAAHDNEQLLKAAGQLLKQSMEGMIVLLHSRNELKNAIRTDLTRLARENNNPLKFTASAEDALAKMLAPNSQRGYLPADKAIDEAVDDLKAHQLAMLEGMKAAVRSMLIKFDPDKLEQMLEKANPIAANIPITREAKLWQLFQEKFGDIRDEAFKDFNELFGQEFRKAYEKRIAELGRKPDF